MAKRDRSGFYIMIRWQPCLRQKVDPKSRTYIYRGTTVQFPNIVSQSLHSDYQNRVKTPYRAITVNSDKVNNLCLVLRKRHLNDRSIVNTGLLELQNAETGAARGPGDRI